MGPGPVTPEKTLELASDPDLPAAHRGLHALRPAASRVYFHIIKWNFLQIGRSGAALVQKMVKCSGSSAATPQGAQTAAVFSPVSSLHLLPGASVLALQTSSPMTRKLVQLSLTQEAREGPREDTDWPVWVTCPPLKSSLQPAPGRPLWLSPLIYGPPRSTTVSGYFLVLLDTSPRSFLSYYR